MAKLSILAGTTSKTVKVFIQDSSATTGVGLGSLVFNTSNLIAYYIREGAGASVAISLVTATLGTWTSSGFIVVDGTHMLGLYELSLPDAAIAAGAKSVVIYLSGATNMAPCILEIELTAVDNQNAVRYGMTALPNAAPNAAGGLLITAAGSLDMDEAVADIDEIVAFGAPPAASVIVAAILAAAVGAAPWNTTLVSDILKAVWSQSIGKWALVGTTLTIYAPDGTTVVKSFTLDSATAPTTRS